MGKTLRKKTGGETVMPRNRMHRRPRVRTQVNSQRNLKWLTLSKALTC